MTASRIRLSEHSLVDQSPGRVEEERLARVVSTPPLPSGRVMACLLAVTESIQLAQGDLPSRIPVYFS